MLKKRATLGLLVSAFACNAQIQTTGYTMEECGQLLMSVSYDSRLLVELAEQIQQQKADIKECNKGTEQCIGDKAKLHLNINAFGQKSGVLKSDTLEAVSRCMSALDVIKQD